MSRPTRVAVAIYVVTAIVLWPVPLLNTLHVESAAVLACVGFFVSGASCIALLRRGFHSSAVLVAQLCLLLVPLLLILVARLWAPGCSLAAGMMFFGLFPAISVVLATGLGSLFDALEVKRPTLLFFVAGAAVCAFTPVYDLGLHPQLYTYNHVFGGVLGPIYDEELAIRPGLFAFRLATLLWGVLFFLSAAMVRRSAGFGSPLTAAAVAVTIALVVGYVYSDDLGWNTTHDVLQEALDDMMVTEHFEVHYDERTFLPVELDLLAAEMEFRYHMIAERLDADVPERILVYLYPTAELKGGLTGSRYTSVTPVWLPRPQIHMLARRIDESFDHELVHVFSREFGMPVVKASRSIGLVEGLASALESPDGRPSVGDLMAATIMSGDRDSSETVDDLVAGLGAFGFWTGRGAVSYAASGSFVDYLLRSYGPDPFKTVYRTSNFEAAYGRSIDELAGEWYHDLKSAEFVSAAALPTAQRLFAIPSLFEVECPHGLPEYVEAYRDANDHLAVRDTTSAVLSLQRSVAVRDDYLPAAVALASIWIRKGQIDEARHTLGDDSSRLAYSTVKLLAADIAALDGQDDISERLYSQLLDSLPDYAHEARAAVLLRRHYANQPDVIRGLGGAPNPAAESRAVSVDPAAAAVMLVSNLRARRYDEACKAGLAKPHYLEAGFLPDEALVLNRQHLLWLGDACEAAGNLDAADRAYAGAAKAYFDVGLIDLWRVAMDRQERVRWKHSREAGRRSN